MLVRTQSSWNSYIYMANSVKQFNHFGQLFGSFLESKSNSPPRYLPKRNETYVHKKSYMRMFRAVFLIIDKNLEKTPMSTIGRMDKQIVIFIKLNTTRQRKKNSGMYNYTEESQKGYVD